MENTFKLGYHSHSTRTYNTEIEKLEQEFLEKIFFGQILCPNKNLTSAKITEHYLEIVKKVDCLFVSEIDGFLGKGSFGECEMAFQENIPVFVIKKNETVMSVEKVTELIQISDYNLWEYGYLKSKRVS